MHSGDIRAGALWGGDLNDWPGDHDMMCGDPNQTHRTIHIPDGTPATAKGQTYPQGAEVFFYPCLPGNDPAKGHLMTSVNTEGYTVTWFSPKPMFANVRRVCWSQNLTWLSNGKWTQVAFVTAAEMGSNTKDLGFTSPEYSSITGLPSSDRGPAAHGVKVRFDNNQQNQMAVTLQSWSTRNEWNPRSLGIGRGTTDKAGRYELCVRDNEDGTVRLSGVGVDGVTRAANVPGNIPNEPIRVVFEDDQYNPDKHNGGPESGGDLAVGSNQGHGYTWHWDDVRVEVG